MNTTTNVPGADTDIEEIVGSSGVANEVRRSGTTEPVRVLDAARALNDGKEVQSVYLSNGHWTAVLSDGKRWILKRV